jgi:hypothetical protein
MYGVKKRNIGTRNRENYNEEKEYAFSEAKATADKFNADRYLNMSRYTYRESISL